VVALSQKVAKPEPRRLHGGVLSAFKDTLHVSKMMIDDERACGADDVAKPLNAEAERGR